MVDSEKEAPQSTPQPIERPWVAPLPPAVQTQLTRHGSEARMAVISSPPLFFSFFPPPAFFLKEESAVFYLVIDLHCSNMFALSLLLFQGGGRFPLALISRRRCSPEKLSYSALLCRLSFDVLSPPPPSAEPALCLKCLCNYNMYDARMCVASGSSQAYKEGLEDLCWKQL